MIYPIKWMGLWKTLTKFMSIAILIPVSFLLVIRLFTQGYEKAFEHISLSQTPLLILGVVLFSTAFSFVISIAIKFAYIKIEDGNLFGRNYWYFKKTIPINEIIDLYLFSDNGIEAIVADGGSHGKVYISTHTDNLDELLQYIEIHSGCKFNA